MSSSAKEREERKKGFCVETKTNEKLVYCRPCSHATQETGPLYDRPSFTTC